LTILLENCTDEHGHHKHRSDDDHKDSDKPVAHDRTPVLDRDWVDTNGWTTPQAPMIDSIGSFLFAES
jgi:hypothetical protein